MFLICKTTAVDDTVYASVEITPEKAAELLALRFIREQTEKAVAAMRHVGDLYSVELWDGHVNFDDGADLDEDDFDRLDNLPWLSSEADPVGEGEPWTSVRTLTVTDTGVFWSASPKHANDYFETPEISWARLFDLARGQNPFPSAAPVAAEEVGSDEGDPD